MNEAEFQFSVVSEVCASFLGSAAKDIYVSPNGKDRPHCGNSNDPCATLNHAVEEMSVSDDVIRIDGKSGNISLLRPIVIKPKSPQFNITFTSFNGTARILAVRKDGDSFVKDEIPYVYRYAKLTVTVTDLRFFNVHLFDFHHGYMKGWGHLFYVTSQRCVFNYASYINGSSYILMNHGFSYTILIQDSSVETNGKTGMLKLGKDSDYADGLTLDVENSTFRDLSFYLLNAAVIVLPGNLFLSVKKSHFESKMKSQNTVLFDTGRFNSQKISIKHSIFNGLGSLLKASGNINLELTNSNFVKNRGIRGTAIALDANDDEAVKISNCKFIGNRAISQAMCGDGKLLGNGGAICVVGKSKLSIESSIFVDNSASCFGDAIYGDVTDIQVRNVTLRSSKLLATSAGMIWYSISSKLSVNGVEFIEADAVKRSRTLYMAQAENFKVGAKGLRFQCPLGSNISYSQQAEGGKVTKVACNFCPKKTYTTEKSYATIKNVTDLTEMIYNIECQQCPPGANCSSTIRPQKNFWGYTYKKKAYLMACPPGYCCQSNVECKDLSSCNNQRHGVLCSSCPTGQSQSIFADDCISDNKCSAWKFWAILSSMCLGFFFLIAYMQDVVSAAINLLNLKSLLEEIRKRFVARKLLNRGAENLLIQVSTLQTTQENAERPEVLEERLTNTMLVNEPHILSMESSTTSGLIKILFFYYQMNALLITYKTATQVNVFSHIKSFFNDLFNLHTNSASLSELGCPMPGMNTIGKNFVRASLPFMILCLAMIFYIVMATFELVSGSRSIREGVERFKSRLLVTILQIILLGYASLTSNIFALLTCVSLSNGEKVVFIQGNVNCYQTWQYLALSFVLFWSLPLAFSLYKASKRLEKKTLSVKGFFFALVCPLPFTVYSVVKEILAERSKAEVLEMQYPNVIGTRNDILEPLLQNTEEQQQQRENKTQQHCQEDQQQNKQQQQNQKQRQQQLNIKRQRLLDVLGSSFRFAGKHDGRLSWEPFLILQRLFLLTLHTFITSPIVKSVPLLAAVLAMSKINIVVRPFHSTFLNFINCLYFSFLCVSGVNNTLYACIYVGETAPLGSLLVTLSILDTIELVMQLLFPCVVTLIIVALVITKLVQFLYYALSSVLCISKKCMK